MVIFHVVALHPVYHRITVSQEFLSLLFCLLRLCYAEGIHFSTHDLTRYHHCHYYVHIADNMVHDIDDVGRSVRIEIIEIEEIELHLALFGLSHCHSMLDGDWKLPQIGELLVETIAVLDRYWKFPQIG